MDMNIDVRLIEKNELKLAEGIMEDGRQLLKSSLSSQWQNGHPNIGLLEKDIMLQELYGVFVNGKLGFIGAIIKGPDPSYRNIYKGKWLTVSDNYYAIHTMACSSKFYGLHLSKYIFNKAEEICRKNNCNSIRIDTYKKNDKMKKALEYDGFDKCGIIYLVDETIDNDRVAFEKIISKE